MTTALSFEGLDDLVAMALEDPSCGRNPVELNADNMRALFEAAL
ncbi:hypothetical protein [Ruegeria sp. HKCCD8929]|nr:hypothetical protein [Ruegeria sp. HKCCD8929]